MYACVRMCVCVCVCVCLLVRVCVLASVWVLEGDHRFHDVVSFFHFA